MSRQLRAHFAKKTPPPKEKLDPVKVMRTINALKRPPPPPPDSNYVRIIKKTYEEARRSGSTSSDARLAEQRSGKRIPQLGEQEKQSCPPLKVSSDIVANHPGMVPGTNPGDYLGDDVIFQTAEVTKEYEYLHGKPLVEPDHPPLTTMMYKLHEWYMKPYRESGRDTMYLAVKPEHEFIGLSVMPVEFVELFQLYNQRALDKQLMTAYCL